MSGMRQTKQSSSPGPWVGNGGGSGVKPNFFRSWRTYDLNGDYDVDFDFTGPFDYPHPFFRIDMMGTVYRAGNVNNRSITPSVFFTKNGTSSLTTLPSLASPFDTGVPYLGRWSFVFNAGLVQGDFAYADKNVAPVWTTNSYLAYPSLGSVGDMSNGGRLTVRLSIGGTSTNPVEVDYILINEYYNHV